jgi:beta-lactamase superfamily II metal-dependent hydrolase
MQKNRLSVFVVFATVVLFSSLSNAKSKTLQVYAIDVEGGQSTLIVSPSGQSLLIDTGWPGNKGRDADRIVAAAKSAGLKQIDYVLITHFHRDHVGGVPQLVERFKIDTFVDHGPNLEDADDPKQDYAAYEKVLSGHKHLVLKPGDHVPIKGIDVLVLTAAGEHIQNALPGAGKPNPACADEPKPKADDTENARSLGTLITYGKFRMLDLGDLTKDKELELMCPNNLIGTVDLFIVSHHGWSQSNTNAFVSAIHPQSAIMNNGARKGGSPDVWTIVNHVVGPERLWQLHYSVEGGAEHNVPEKFIANPDEKNDQGKDIRVVAHKDSTFEIINSRNNFQWQYNVKVDVTGASGK